MVAVALEVRDVPPAPEVRSHLVMGGAAEPHGDDPPPSRSSTKTKHCSRSASWSFAPGEGRVPVVRRVEEHVVADGPAGLADDAPVVDEPDLRADRRVLTSAAAIVPPGTLPRTRSERSKPASMSRATTPTRARRRGAKTRPPRPAAPPGEVCTVERPLDELKELALPGRRSREGRKRVRRQLHQRDEQRAVALRGPGPELALRDVRDRRHREEELALRVADDRLEAAEQLEVPGGVAGFGGGAVPAVRSRAVRRSRGVAHDAVGHNVRRPGERGVDAPRPSRRRAEPRSG